ncbi:hypothetical protein C8K30_1011045 [Promicromonospora sp. AC04]|uniref:hypothetical protein n=1 Tax=Promicromonospora sp. AC04 TaxID=2135723 RepID=UPI000D3684B1|nr:hypothetical protein [Promicromonospora sp. AC04]PUB32519.1 hypothetical protein C8K30_1011045 [Promicromonospora sp. AC04]
MTSQHTPVTVDSARFTFYDIESLSDVFTLCAYTPEPDSAVDGLEIFFLADDAQLADAVDPQALYEVVVRSNPGLPPVSVQLWNLRGERGNLRLAELVGLSDAEQVTDTSSPSAYPAYLRPVCDTDPGYDPIKHPFLAGYNSMNYDTVMLALYLHEAFPAPHSDRLFQPATARGMREHNDRLFAEHNDYMPGYLGWDGPAARIRRAMLHSGRHLDVARLNEQQFKVSLKRLLGMLGGQIKESDKLSHDTSIRSLEELYELLAYNVSDCLGLAQLSHHPVYASSFDLKAGLIAQYGETVYAQDGTIRRDRLTIDASSAKFVGRILAPYTPLNDIEAVSFLYPAKEVAAQQGIAQVNVLDECVRFFEEHVAPDPATNPGTTRAQASAHRQFMEVVRYYRSIEGKNFNDSDEYQDLFTLPANSLRDVPKPPNNVPYFRPDATPSSCFVTFSTGGIHGAEADLSAFTLDRIAYFEADTMLQRAKVAYPDPKDLLAEARRQHNLLTLPDGTHVDKRLVLVGSDPQKVKYRKPKKSDPEQGAQLARAQEQVPDPAELLATQRPENEALHVRLADETLLDGKVVLAATSATRAAYRDEPVRKAPDLFVTKTGDPNDRSTKLHPRYARTSAGLVIHEDFTSYYPNLLRNMRAFYNPELGEDRYATIFFEKERLGAALKTPGTSAQDRARLKTLREGTKLILNAASGAGDASHRTPIRMNNQIISMRILGQLFSWRIGQAQTLAGARIISTNTDGLYSVVDGGNGFDEATNNQVLAEHQAAIGIDIEPELMFLISKDSNNRLELEPAPAGRSVADSAILAAGGGTLACHAGPTPTKSLAHPAVIDFALARYLQTVASRGEQTLAETFDPVLGRKTIEEAIDLARPVATLLLFQNVIAASRGSITYPFAADPINIGSDDVQDAEPDGDAQLTNPRTLQMVNRIFIVHNGTAAAVSLHNAGAWKVSPASRDKRRANGSAGVRRDPVALDILRHHGWARNRSEAIATDGLRVLPDDQDVAVRRINGIDPAWPVVVVNDDLRALRPDQVDRLVTSLDLDVYTRMLGETFTKNWMNAT